MLSMNKDFILERAKQDLSQALVILSQDELCGRLNIIELMEVITSHPKFIQHVLEDESVLDVLDGYMLAQIGCKDLQAANLFLDKYAFKLVGFDLALIGEKHSDFATKVYNTENFKSKLSSNQLVTMVMPHKVLRDKLFKDKDALLKLNRADLARLLACDDDYIAFALQDISVLKKLVADFDAVPKEEKEIPGIYKHIDGDMLAIVGQNSEKYAKQFLTDENFKNNFQGVAFATIARRNLNIARLVLDIEDGPKKMGDVGFGKLATYHESIAKEYVVDKKYRSFTSKLVVSMIAEKYPQFAPAIQAEESLKKIMQSEVKQQALALGGVTGVPNQHFDVSLGVHNHDIAMKYIQDPNIRVNLTAGELVLLGQNHIDVAKIIMSTPHLINKLSFDQAGALLKKHTHELIMLLQDKQVEEGMSRIGLLCREYLFICQDVVNNPQLKNKVSKSYFQHLSERVNIANTLRQGIIQHWNYGDEYEPLERNKLLLTQFNSNNARPCELSKDDSKKSSKQRMNV